MSSLSFLECCHLFAVDPKTLRQWLAQAQMSLQTHPKDGRIKCLSGEQVEILARLHGLTVPPAPEMSEAHARPEQMMPVPDADLRARLAQMEAQVAALQAQLVDLTLQLLSEREHHTEQRLLALEAERGSREADDMAEPVEGTLALASQVVLPAFARHATEKRLIPLIEYGARGRYVLISPEEGELAITPDSPEWFKWVASLSSFRFVGQSGRFSARRGFSRRPNRGWYAQRTIHQQFRGKYIGVSEHVTIARLEYIAAELQSPM